MPFNTQFFHDDYDDGPGFDDVYDGDGMGTPDADVGEQDLLAATAGQTRRVRPQSVNYAKRAKRVDVRKLKENIWKGLDIVAAPQESEDNMVRSYIFLRAMRMLTWCHQDVDETSNRPGTAPEGRAFSQVINGLQKSYPRDKMEEISTSFCFICLLHLANEQGLKIETNPCEMNGGDDNDIGRRVGDIWGLKVHFA